MRTTDPIGRLLYRIAVAAVVPLAAATGCSRSQAASPPAAGQPPTTVAVVKAERRDLAETLTIAADFRPFQQIDVHAKVAGFLKTIFVDVGDRVRAGQLLAVLEVPELQEETHQDEATVERSVHDVSRARADLERAESAHEVAHLGSTRLAGVLKTRPNLIAQQDIDDAAAKDRIAEASVATAKAAVASAEQQLAVSKAMAGKTKALVDYTRIVAPFSGVITRRYADTGAMIQAGTSSATQAMPLVTLSQTDRLRLTIPIPESAVAHIRVGAPVEVRVDAVERTFSGTVARFAHTVNADTRTMATEVDVANPDQTLVPGMYAHATLAVADVKDALTIPVQALDRGEDKSTVLVVESGTLARRDVRTGLEAPDRIAILAGLKEGDLVVVGNRSQLRVGTPVTPRIETGAAARRSE
jgi:RND family efflux transporter MFP subunit